MPVFCLCSVFDRSGKKLSGCHKVVNLAEDVVVNCVLCFLNCSRSVLRQNTVSGYVLLFYATSIFFATVYRILVCSIFEWTNSKLKKNHFKKHKIEKSSAKVTIYLLMYS